ncbi:kinesin-like protein KIN-14R, partial [Tanacetum coccineum]
VGFNQLGGTDDFSTEELEERMSIGSSLEIKLMDIAYNVGKNIEVCSSELKLHIPYSTLVLCTEKNPGVNYRTLEALFDTVDERKDTFSFNISICVLEVYNEQIKSGICLLPHEQQRSKNVLKIIIRKCMGNSEANVDNEVLKYEQDSQEVYRVKLVRIWEAGVAPPMEQREEVYDPLATPDVDKDVLAQMKKNAAAGTTPSSVPMPTLPPSALNLP